MKKHDLHVDLVTKVHEDENADDNILNELRDDKIDLVINTMGHDIEKNSDGFIIRQMAIQQNVPLLLHLILRMHFLLHLRIDHLRLML